MAGLSNVPRAVGPGYNDPMNEPADAALTDSVPPGAFNLNALPRAPWTKKHTPQSTPGVPWPPINKQDKWGQMNATLVLPHPYKEYNLNSLPHNPNAKRTPGTTPWTQETAEKQLTESSSTGAIEPPGPDPLAIARSYAESSADPVEREWWQRRVNSLSQFEAISLSRPLRPDEAQIKKDIILEISKRSEETPLAINAAPLVPGPAPAIPAPAPLFAGVVGHAPPPAPGPPGPFPGPRGPPGPGPGPGPAPGPAPVMIHMPAAAQPGLMSRIAGNAISIGRSVASGVAAAASAPLNLAASLQQPVDRPLPMVPEPVLPSRRRAALNRDAFNAMLVEAVQKNARDQERAARQEQNLQDMAFASRDITANLRAAVSMLEAHEAGLPVSEVESKHDTPEERHARERERRRGMPAPARRVPRIQGAPVEEFMGPAAIVPEVFEEAEEIPEEKETPTIMDLGPPSNAKANVVIMPNRDLLILEKILEAKYGRTAPDTDLKEEWQYILSSVGKRGTPVAKYMYRKPAKGSNDLPGFIISKLAESPKHSAILIKYLVAPDESGMPSTAPLDKYARTDKLVEMAEASAEGKFLFHPNYTAEIM